MLHMSIARLVRNMFCKTGQGGGVDPSCGKEGGSSGGPPPPPKVGEKIVVGGQTYTVSGGGMPSKRGPNKGRTPVVARDAHDNVRIFYTDQLQGHAPTPTPPKPAPSPKPPPTPPKPSPSPTPAPTKSSPKEMTRADVLKAVEHARGDDPEKPYEPVGTGTVDTSKMRDKSVEVLDSLPPSARSEVLGMSKVPGFELRKVKIADIVHTQHGEDRINDASRESARAIKAGKMSQVAKADLAPIILDQHNTIVDGNHRFSAAEMNGQEHIYAMVPSKGTTVKDKASVTGRR